jgi:hypothetical protein
VRKVPTVAHPSWFAGRWAKTERPRNFHIPGRGLEAGAVVNILILPL